MGDGFSRGLLPWMGRDASVQRITPTMLIATVYIAATECAVFFTVSDCEEVTVHEIRTATGSISRGAASLDYAKVGTPFYPGLKEILLECYQSAIREP